MNKIDEIKAPVKEELEQFNIQFSAALSSHVNLLQSAFDHIIESTGKHIRPLLLLLTSRVFNSDNKNAIQAAILVELLHTATLIHDDVIDETKQRRGVPSLNAIYDNRVSVLVGDYVLSSALIRSIQLGNLKVIKIISNLGRELSEGEISQLEAADLSLISEDRYMKVIEKKTASLLAACAQIGAIMADASEEEESLCYEIGLNMGYCFQIKDDIFDYYKEDVGKPTGNDIREGKVTLPLLYALKKGDEKLRKEMIQIIKEKQYEEESVIRLIQFAKENGGIEYARKKMEHYYQKSISLINQLPENDARTSLLNLADYIISRNK